MKGLRMKKDYNLVIEERRKYLLVKGWIPSDSGVWTRPNWKKEGVCNRQLTNAYRIQLKLDAAEREQKMAEVEEVAKTLAG